MKYQNFLEVCSIDIKELYRSPPIDVISDILGFLRFIGREYNF